MIGLIRTLTHIAAVTATLGLVPALWPLPAIACDTTSLTDTSCGPNNPLNPNNPFSPNSPVNLANPTNPASPFNPALQQRRNGYYGDPYYGGAGAGLLGAMLPGLFAGGQNVEAAPPDAGAAAPIVRPRHHRHRRLVK